MNPEVRTRRHILTVNVEDYYHVGAFNRFIQKHRWQRFESRIEFSTDRTLHLLDRHRATATFFVLGWVAEQFPDAIRKLAEAGHEVGVRGFYHRGVSELTPEEFRADAVRARAAVEAATGVRALGYRLADGWLGPDDLWVLDELAELGFAFDSSIAPIRRLFADEPQRHAPHRHPSGLHAIQEIPVSCGRVLGVRVPVAGGNYLRQLPRWLTRRAAQHWVDMHPSPLVAYFHTWELDDEQPRITAGGRLTQLRQYRNLKAMPERLAELLSDFSFGPIREFLKLEPEPIARTEPGIARTATLTTTLPDSERPPISIVVPCFNEELIVPHLKKTLDEVRLQLSETYDPTFVLVDDGSQDRTWENLTATFGGQPGFDLIRHERNLGVAAAIMTGIRGAKNEIVCSMDCDCSYDPLKLAELIPLLQPGVDLVTASPYHPAGAVRNVPGWRLLLSRGAAWMYRRVLRTKLHTYTSCFRVYRRSAVAGIELKHHRFLGVAELVGRLDLDRKQIVEHPAVLEVRMIGRSKMKTVRTILGHLGLLAGLARARFAQWWRRPHASAIRATNVLPQDPLAASAIPCSPVPHP